MKITRTQIRKIIKEAMDQESKDPKDLEAHYAITYAQVYLVMYKFKLDSEGFDRTVDRSAGERQSPGYTKIMQALNTLIKALGEVKTHGQFYNKQIAKTVGNILEIKTEGIALSLSLPVK